MNVPGKMNPLPMDDGTRKSKYSQSGRPLVMKRRQAVPIRRRIVPAINGGLRSRVYVMMKPVAVPTAEEHNVGTTRRRPELVALSRRTAWKKRGILKVILLEIIDAMAFETMRPRRGLRTIIFKGIMGRGVWYSTQMNRGKQIMQIVREETTKG